MKIGELAAASGVPASTIRYWEKVGVLKPPSRVGGQRRYPAESLHLLAVLKLSQACGLSLPEMRELLHGFTPGFRASRRWRQVLTVKQAELDAQIGKLQAMRELVGKVQTCECSELMECGRKASKAMGVDTSRLGGATSRGS